jgi:predicted molibdopterin-dependent oxidoreductase YjgC
MSELRVLVDGREVHVPAGATVAAALARAGLLAWRRSVRGAPRGPLCGMGICYECRVTIDDRAHALACQTPCEEGMRVSTA